jgi:hypothetical protein
MNQTKIEMEAVRKIKHPLLKLISQSQNSFQKHLFAEVSFGVPFGGRRPPLQESATVI